MKKRTIITLGLMASLSLHAQQSVRQQGFPKAVDAKGDMVEWQREIYREIDLEKDANAGLFCPAETEQHQEGLFRKLFRLVADSIIPAYQYQIDYNEVFSERTKADFKAILENFHVPYSLKDSSIVVEDADIPASEVRMYYVREAMYYDLSNSSFRKRIVALCPVIIMEDEFTDEPVKYPLFWVRYKDLQPYLRRMTIIPDYANKATWMTMDEYFTLGKYRGEIYKVYNPHGRTLMQYAETDSAMAAQRQHIEEELLDVQERTFSSPRRKIATSGKQD